MPESVLQTLQLDNSAHKNVSEMRKFHNKFTSVLPFLPNAVKSRREICVMRTQALTKVNTTQAWFGRNGYLQGSNKGLSKHASATQSTMDCRRVLGWLGEGTLGRRVSGRLGVSHSVIRRLQECFQTSGCA